MPVPCTELGNPLGDQLANLVARDHLTLIGGVHTALDSGCGFCVYLDFFSAGNHRSRLSISHIEV